MKKKKGKREGKEGIGAGKGRGRGRKRRGIWKCGDVTKALKGERQGWVKTSQGYM